MSDQNLFKDIKGLKPADPAVVEEFKQKMRDEVIPRILDAVFERQVAAAKIRHKIILY